MKIKVPVTLDIGWISLKRMHVVREHNGCMNVI